MKVKGAVKVFLMAVVITYPVFVFLALMVFHLPVSIVSLGMLIIAIAYFAFVSGDGGKNWTAIILGVLAIVVLLTQSELVLKFYPVVMTGVFLVMFGVPLLKGRPIITRFAMMMDPAIAAHPARGILERCCKGLNIAWCVHLVISLGINIAICFGSTLEVWTIYNTVVSYVVIVLLVSLQFLVIWLANRKADLKVTFGMMTPSARPRDYIVGYYGEHYEYLSPQNRTWGDLFDAVDALLPAMKGGDGVHKATLTDLWEFTVTLTAARTAGVKVLFGGKPEIDLSKPGAIDDTMVYTSFISELWEKTGGKDGSFTFLCCPDKRRVIDLVRGACAR